MNEYAKLSIPFVVVISGAILAIIQKILHLKSKVPPEYLELFEGSMIFLSHLIAGTIALFFAGYATEEIFLLAGFGGIFGYKGVDVIEFLVKYFEKKLK